MKPTIQYDCMNTECNTVILGMNKNLDGLRCPRCEGPVTPKPYPAKRISEDAQYVRSKIIERCHKHCFDLTPEQVETVIELYKQKKREDFKPFEASIPLYIDGRELAKIVEGNIIKDKNRNGRF